MGHCAFCVASHHSIGKPFDPLDMGCVHAVGQLPDEGPLHNHSYRRRNIVYRCETEYVMQAISMDRHARSVCEDLTTGVQPL